jgi:hypothetical protein
MTDILVKHTSNNDMVSLCVGAEYIRTVRVGAELGFHGDTGVQWCDVYTLLHVGMYVYSLLHVGTFIHYFM